MRLFTEALPETIVVNGKDYPIRTDFRTWVEFDRLLTETSLSLQEKVVAVLKLCFVKKEIPADLINAFSALFRFYSCNPPEGNGQKTDYVSGKKVLSFSVDAPFIYAAILSQYGVDLMEKNPHWFLFRAMFDGLTDDHKICKIIEYRTVRLSHVKDKSMRTFYKNMKRKYQLPEFRTPEEIERDTVNHLAKLV